MAEPKYKLPRSKKTGSEEVGSWIAPEIRALLNWAKSQGLVGKHTIQGDAGPNPDKEGEYLLKSKDINVVGPPVIINNTLLHELVHAIGQNKSKSKSVADDYAKLSFLDKFIGGDVVMPRHWTQGMVDNPLTGTPSTTSSGYSFPNPPTGRDELNSRVHKMARQSFDAMKEPVINSIKKGHTLSGLRDSSNFFTVPEGTAEEVVTHYTTNPKIARRHSDSSIRLGLYLLDHGAPMNLVEPLVNRFDSLKLLWDEAPTKGEVQ